MLAIKLFLKNGKNSVMSRNLGSYSYTNGDPSYLEVQIKPQELIDEVTFDPRITKEDFDIQILNN